MFERFRKRRSAANFIHRTPEITAAGRSVVQVLESRRLMSAAHHGVHGRPDGGHGSGRGAAVSELAFSLVPTAVQTGLTTLAGTDGFTAPISTTEVYLGNRNGVETYSIREAGTGTSSLITIDSAGVAVTAPSKRTTTFGAISNSAVTDEFNAVATALNLTAPASTDSVGVSIDSNSQTIYTLALTSTTTSGRKRTTRFSVDFEGNFVGNTRVPLSVLSTAIQNGLTSAAPAGATALTATSLINVQTIDGVTLYTAHYSATGTKTSVTVNTAGVPTSLPTSTTITFAAVPSTASVELQALATAEGYTSTIDTTTSVKQTTEANGVVLYTVRLSVTDTTDSTRTHSLVLTVDAAGNPTVLGGGGISGARGSGGFC